MKLRADLVGKFKVDDGPVDVSRWFQRYELFVDCSEGKMESEFDRSGLYLRYLPLFLTGTALMCFEEMPHEDKIAYILVKHQLVSISLLMLQLLIQSLLIRSSPQEWESTVSLHCSDVIPI